MWRRPTARTDKTDNGTTYPYPALVCLQAEPDERTELLLQVWTPIHFGSLRRRSLWCGAGTRPNPTKQITAGPSPILWLSASKSLVALACLQAEPDGPTQLLVYACIPTSSSSKIEAFWLTWASLILVRRRPTATTDKTDNGRTLPYPLAIGMSSVVSLACLQAEPDGPTQLLV